MMGRWATCACLLAAAAGAAGVPAVPPAEAEQAGYTEMAVFAAALIPEGAIRAVALSYSPGFSIYRDVRMVAYVENGTANLSVDVSWAAGGGETYDEAMALPDFDALWEDLAREGLLRLETAVPAYEGPPPTDTVTFAVAWRDGADAGGFAVRDPGSLSDGRYDRIVRRLDELLSASLQRKRSINE